MEIEDYKKMTLRELELEYTSLSDKDLDTKEGLLRSWCKRLYAEGKKDEALAKTKEYIYLMLKQRFVYDDARDFFTFKPVSEYLLEELSTGKVSLSPAERFNDPIDPVINTWIKNKIETSINEDDISFACLLQKVVELFRIKCFVRTSPLLKGESLQENDNQNIEDISPLMWAHYANGHRGVCMQYEIPPEALKDDGKRSFLSLFPVQYENKIELGQELSIDIALCAKAKDWEYENEVRLVLFDPNMKDEFPTIEGLRLKAAYLGVNCLDSDERKIRLALQNKPVKLYRMYIQPTNLNRFVAKRIG